MLKGRETSSIYRKTHAPRRVEKTSDPPALFFRYAAELCAARTNLSSDDSKKPKDQDQDQQTAKTDIHLNSSRFVLLLKRRAVLARSIRFGFSTKPDGIILPFRKLPDLLDFRPLTRE